MTRIILATLCYLLLSACATDDPQPTPDDGPLIVYWCHADCTFPGGGGSEYAQYIAAPSRQEGRDQMIALGEWNSPATCEAYCEEKTQ